MMWLFRLAVVLSLLPPAHASLVSAVPEPGSTVAAPSELRLTFDEQLAAGSRVVLYRGTFEAVQGVNSTLEGQVLRVALAHELEPGTYTVQWMAVTDDGHRVEGSYQFGVSESRQQLWVVAWIVAGAVIIAAGFGAMIAPRGRGQKRGSRGRADVAGG